MSAASRNEQVVVEAARGSLFESLLGGLLCQPVGRGEIAQAAQGPARFDAVDDIDEVNLRVDAENDAVVDEGKCGSESLAAAHGPGEQEVAACDGKVKWTPEIGPEAKVV